MTACLSTEVQQHPAWCDRSQCLPDPDGPAHSSTSQYLKASSEGQLVELYLSQVPGDAPRVILGDSDAPVEYTLVLTIPEAADLIGRLAPLVAAAASNEGRCGS